MSTFSGFGSFAKDETNFFNNIKKWFSYKSNLMKIILIAIFVVIMIFGAITLMVVYKYHPKMFERCNIVSYLFLSFFFGIVSTFFITLTSIFVIPIGYFAYRMVYITSTTIFFKLKYKSVDNVVRKIMNRTKRSKLSMGVYIAREYDEYSEDDKMYEAMNGEYPVNAEQIHYIVHCCVISGVDTKFIPKMNDLLYRQFAYKLMLRAADITKYSINEIIGIDMIAIIQ